MSDANRTKISLVKESVFGTTPTPPVFRNQRITSAGLGFQPRTGESAELRSDRQIPDAPRLGYEAGGPLGFEMSYGSIDNILEVGLYSAWVNTNFRYNETATTQITDVDTTTYTVASGTAFASGDLVYASGFAIAQNNGLKVLTGGSATTAVTTGLAAETPGLGARVKKVGIEGGTGVISATASGLSRSGGSWITDGFVAGMWVFVGGAVAQDANSFATAAVRGWCRIAASGVTASDLTFDRTPVGWTTDAGTGKAIRVWLPDYLRNGTTAQSFTIEQVFEDIASPEYHLFLGQRVGTIQLAAEAQAILTGSATFMGTQAPAPSTTRTAGATDVLPPTGEIMTASTHVGAVSVNGALVASPNFIMGFGLQVDNRLRRNNAVGSEASVAIGSGRCAVTGNLNTYYGDKTILEYLRNNTNVSYDVRFNDPNGQSVLLVDVPRIKLSAGDPSVPGADTDRMLDMQFMGLRHATFGFTIQFQRFEYTPQS